MVIVGNKVAPNYNKSGKSTRYSLMGRENLQFRHGLGVFACEILYTNVCRCMKARTEKKSVSFRHTRPTLSV